MLTAEMQVWHHKQRLASSSLKGERLQAQKLESKFTKTHEDILSKQRVDLANLMKLGPVKPSTVKQYLAKLAELKKAAYKVITED